MRGVHKIVYERTNAPSIKSANDCVRYHNVSVQRDIYICAIHFGAFLGRLFDSCCDRDGMLSGLVHFSWFLCCPFAQVRSLAGDCLLIHRWTGGTNEIPRKIWFGDESKAQVDAVA
jgi:hypothetical protein